MCVFWWTLHCFKYLGTIFACIEWNHELRKLVSFHHETPNDVLVDFFLWKCWFTFFAGMNFFCESSLQLPFLGIFWCKLDGSKCLVTCQEQIFFFFTGTIFFFFLLQAKFSSNTGWSTLRNHFDRAWIPWTLKKVGRRKAKVPKKEARVV